jgi:hypothetical protein
VQRWCAEGGVARKKIPTNFASKTLWWECHDVVVGQSLIIHKMSAKVVVASQIFGLAISGEKISYMTVFINMIPYMILKTFYFSR